MHGTAQGSPLDAGPGSRNAIEPDTNGEPDEEGAIKTIPPDPTTSTELNESTGAEESTIVIGKKVRRKTAIGNIKYTGSSMSPVVNDNGVCLKCSFTSAQTTSIGCHICKKMFHANCFDDQGAASPESICTKTQLTNVRPLLNKDDGKCNRWGHFYFVCDECNDEMKHFLISRDPKPTLQEFAVQTDFSASDIQGDDRGQTGTNLFSANNDISIDPNHDSIDMNEIANLVSQTVLKMKDDINQFVIQYRREVCKRCILIGI